MISIKELQLFRNQLQISDLNDFIIKEDIFIQIIDKEKHVKFAMLGITKDCLLILTIMDYCDRCLYSRKPSWKKGCALLRKVPLTDITVNKRERKIFVNGNHENEYLSFLLSPSLSDFIWNQWCGHLSAYQVENSESFCRSYEIVHEIPKYLHIHSNVNWKEIKSDKPESNRMVPINRFAENINENCVFTLYLPDSVMIDVSDRLFYLSLHSSCISFPLNEIIPNPIVEIGTSLLVKRTSSELSHLRKYNSEIIISESVNSHSYVCASLEDLTPTFVERKYYFSPLLNSSPDIWMCDDNSLISLVGSNSEQDNRRSKYRNKINVMRKHLINSTSREWTHERIESIQNSINTATKLLFLWIQSERKKNNNFKNDEILYLTWKNQITDDIPLRTSYSNLTNQSLQITDISAKLLANEITVIDTNLFLSLRAEELARLILKPSTVNSITCPNLCKLLKFYLKISHLVSYQIVRSNLRKQRVKVILRAIEWADECYKKNNKHSASAIVSGLLSPPVIRLKATWRNLREEHPQYIRKLKTFQRIPHCSEDILEIPLLCDILKIYRVIPSLRSPVTWNTWKEPIDIRNRINIRNEVSERCCLFDKTSLDFLNQNNRRRKDFKNSKPEMSFQRIPCSSLFIFNLLECCATYPKSYNEIYKRINFYLQKLQSKLTLYNISSDISVRNFLLYSNYSNDIWKVSFESEPPRKYYCFCNSKILDLTNKNIT